MIGRTLSHYRIVEKIGAGAMGEVYRAHDERLERDVALKVLPTGTLSDEAARKRFRKEALALSKLNHPNIATVHDFDTQDGTDFLVMELVEGVTLSDKLAAGALSEKEITRLGMQLAEALEEAHERGVVHRDLKPGNVMVTPKGQAKILDFGLAKLLRPVSETATTESFTETQGVAGTLPYMAPEQLRGSAPDHRSDIYSFGVVLYEMATGQRPFQERLATALAHDIITKPPPPPGRLKPDLSPRLEETILKCLEKEPENRYQHANEVAVDLRRLGAPSAAGAPARARALRVKRPLAAGFVMVALIAVLVGLNVGKLREWLLGGVASGQITSIAVLPLENMMGDTEQDYFVEGMHEALITALSKIAALKVISRTSVMRYKETEKPIPEIARELGVDAVIEGSVLRVGNQVRITAQLIEAATDQHLWAQNYDRELRDILALHSEVARAITNEIKLELTPDERMRLDRVQTVNPESHEAYLKGRYLWNKRTRKDLEKAIGYFETAIDADPEYALAYAGLSNAYRALSSSHLPPREVMPKAKAAAIKALELDETLAEAHTSLAEINLFYDWDLTGAKKELDRALELDPNAAEAYALLSMYLTALKRHEEAVPVISRALEINPLSHSVQFNAGWVFFMAGQYDQTIAQCQDAIGIDSNFFWAHAIQGLAYAQTGQFPQAIAASETATQIDDSPLILALLAHTYALAGERDLALKVLDQLMEKAQSRYVCAYEVALAYVGLGEIDEAFQWLEKAYRERADCMLWTRVDRRLDPIRGDPRFQSLLRRMNFSN